MVSPVAAFSELRHCAGNSACHHAHDILSYIWDDGRLVWRRDRDVGSIGIIVIHLNRLPFEQVILAHDVHCRHGLFIRHHAQNVRCILHDAVASRLYAMLHQQALVRPFKCTGRGVVVEATSRTHRREEEVQMVLAQFVCEEVAHRGVGACDKRVEDVAYTLQTHCKADEPAFPLPQRHQGPTAPVWRCMSSSI